MAYGRLIRAKTNTSVIIRQDDVATENIKAALTTKELAQIAAVDLMYLRAEISLLMPSEPTAKRIADHFDVLNWLLERIAQ